MLTQNRAPMVVKMGQVLLDPVLNPTHRTFPQVPEFSLVGDIHSFMLFRANLPAVRTAIRFSFTLSSVLPFPDSFPIANASLFSGLSVISF